MNVTTRIGTTMKDGAQHLASLRDGRAVFLEGQQVADVTTHPAFRNACAAAAAMYDYQAQPENLIYNVLVAILHLLHAQQTDTSYPQRLKDLVETVTDLQRAAMGFPTDWRSRPAWGLA